MNFCFSLFFVYAFGQFDKRTRQPNVNRARSRNRNGQQGQQQQTRRNQRQQQGRRGNPQRGRSQRMPGTLKSRQHLRRAF